jgi:hypothetical protein
MFGNKKRLKNILVMISLVLNERFDLFTLLNFGPLNRPFDSEKRKVGPHIRPLLTSLSCFVAIGRCHFT